MLNLKISGALTIKIKAAIFQGVTLSVPVSLIEHLTNWWLTNQEYATFVFYAIALDHVLGTFKHYHIDQDFSVKENIKGLVMKVGLVVFVGYLFEGIPAIMPKDNFIAGYMITVLRLIVFLYPAGGAFRNSSILSGGKFPPKSWLDRLSKFDKNLNVNDLTNKKQENEESEPN